MKINYTDTVRILTASIPFFLLFSIFIADLFLSLLSVGFFIFSLIKKKFNIFKNSIFLIFLSFYLICTIGSLFTDNINYYLLNSLPLIRFGLFILLIQYLIENDKKFIKYFLNFLLLSILILIIGLFFQIIGIEFISKYVIGNRYSSFFFDEHVMGSYLIKILPLTLSLLLIFNKNKIFYLTIIIVFFMILLSGERAAIFSLSIFIVFLFFFTNLIEIKKKLYIFLMLLLVCISTLYLFPKVKFRVVDQTLYQWGIIEPENDYIEIKVSDDPERFIAIAREEYFIPLKYYLMMSSGIKMSSDNYIFGNGIKSFRIKCKELKYYTKKNYKAFKDKPDDYYEGFTGIDNCSTHPHNYYIQFLAETGVFTFLLVFFVWIYAFYKFIKNNSLETKIIYLSIFVNLFPFITTGNFFNNFIGILLILPISFIGLKQIDKIN